MRRLVLQFLLLMWPYLAFIGCITVVIAFANVALATGKAIFYDSAYNSGFEAGRASTYDQCVRLHYCPSYGRGKDLIVVEGDR